MPYCFRGFIFVQFLRTRSSRFVFILYTLYRTHLTLTFLGTFWYHSHLSTQYCDGLRGAFVVYDPADPYADLYDVDDGEFA